MGGAWFRFGALVVVLSCVFRSFEDLFIGLMIIGRVIIVLLLTLRCRIGAERVRVWMTMGSSCALIRVNFDLGLVLGGRLGICIGDGGCCGVLVLRLLCGLRVICFLRVSCSFLKAL